MWMKGQAGKKLLLYERKPMPVWTRTQFEAFFVLHFKLTMILLCLVWDFTNPLLNSATPLEVFNSARAIIA